MKRPGAIISLAFAVALMAAPAYVRAVPRTSAQAGAGHLYVAATTDGTKPIVLRFPIVNGVPARRPDLRYDRVQAPMAAAPDGTFYATVTMRCCEGLAQIDAFPPNSPRLVRQITLPFLRRDTTVEYALTVGPGGYLYAGYSAFNSGGDNAQAGLPSAHLPHRGIAVYPRNANGVGPPAAAFNLGIGPPTALDFGPDGDLYALTDREVGRNEGLAAIAAARRSPHLDHVVDLPAGWRNAIGFAFSDEGSELYIAAFGGSPRYVVIFVYPASARGHVRPSRTIALPQDVGAGLAIRGGLLYTVSTPPAVPAVYGFPKDASGSPPPVFTLTLPVATRPNLVAVGP